MKTVKALPFKVKGLAEQVIAQEDKDRAVELIDATLRLFVGAIESGHGFEQLKRHFTIFQKEINKAKIGITIEDSAFETLVKHVSPLMYLEYYVQKKETGESIESNLTIVK